MKSREEVEHLLSLEIVTALRGEIEEKGEASLLVSGGSTPVNLFRLLSESDLEWEKVTISLVDERLLPKEHKDSNEKLVLDFLIQNKAKQAGFVSLVENVSVVKENLKLVQELVLNIPRPFTVVVLGMGNDGHTASLFPHAPQLEMGMDLTTEQDLILIDPQTAPYQRISFTRRALLNTKRMFLHCYGAEKKSILDQAQNHDGYQPYPVSGFLNQAQTEVEVYWAK